MPIFRGFLIKSIIKMRGEPNGSPLILDMFIFVKFSIFVPPKAFFSLPFPSFYALSLPFFVTYVYGFSVTYLIGIYIRWVPLRLTGG